MSEDNINDWVRDESLEARIAPTMPIDSPLHYRLRVYAKGALKVIATSELQKDDIRRRHISISHPDRYPTWEEIKDARYTLMGAGVMVAQLLPPITDYVNIHQNCFHLYEILDPRSET